MFFATLLQQVVQPFADGEVECTLGAALRVRDMHVAMREIDVLPARGAHIIDPHAGQQRGTQRVAMRRSLIQAIDKGQMRGSKTEI